MTPEVPKKKISTSEVGHARNVASLIALHQGVSTFDAAVYQPVLKRYEVASLANFIAQAQAVMNVVAEMAALAEVAINARFAIYEKLNDLMLRSIADFESSGASAAAIADARTKYRKIKGQSLKPKAQDNPLTAGVDESQIGNSTSQMSFDQRLAAARAYVQVLAAQGNYATNAAALTVSALTAFLDEVEAKNLAVVQKATAYKTALAARDEVLYHSETGLVATGNGVKKYVGSAFGTKSAEYQMVKDIKFKSNHR